MLAPLRERFAGLGALEEASPTAERRAILQGGLGTRRSLAAAESAP